MQHTHGLSLVGFRRRCAFRRFRFFCVSFVHLCRSFVRSVFHFSRNVRASDGQCSNWSIASMLKYTISRCSSRNSNELFLFFSLLFSSSCICFGRQLLQLCHFGQFYFVFQLLSRTRLEHHAAWMYGNERKGSLILAIYQRTFDTFDAASVCECLQLPICGERGNYIPSQWIRNGDWPQLQLLNYYD